MERVLKRRDFLKGSAVATGGLLFGVPSVLAGEHRTQLQTYTKVDPELFQGINRVADAQKKTILEKKHAPLIALPEKVEAGEPFPVTVTMGEIIHPMGPSHYIHYLELFAGNEPMGRMEFSPAFSVPRATFHLRLDKPVTLVAREYCNLHGLWESRREVEFA